MEESLEDRFFDVLLHTLNYAMEFVNDRGYASLRFMDLFGSLLDLQPHMKEISRTEFYERLREKMKERELTGSQRTQTKLQSELLDIFVNEWRKRTSQA
jgi:hypothetical protein